MKVIIVLAAFAFAVTLATPQGGRRSIPGLPSLPPFVFNGGLCEPLGDVQPSTIPRGQTCTCQSHYVVFGAIYTWGNCTATPSTTTLAPTTSSVAPSNSTTAAPSNSSTAAP